MWPHLQLGSISASLRRFFTAPSSSPFSMVEGRPLQPRTSVTVASSGRCLQVFNNLRAAMPNRRPSGVDAACSRLPVPSGSVPGDFEVGCIEPCRGGVGAGPDCFSFFLFEVPCAICKGMCVILRFLRSLHVKCTATAES
jgi:hypothetical protein